MQTIDTEAAEMGRLVAEAIREDVLSGVAFEDGYANRILGYHHAASQWVDLDHEDSPMSTDTEWYVSTDGDVELETEIGRVYLTTLGDDALERLR